MSLEFTVGLNDATSTPATSMARSMAAAAAQARILATAGTAVEAALVKASALGQSTAKVNALKAAHAQLLGEYQKVAPAANAAAAAAEKEAAASKAASDAKRARIASDVAASKTLGVLRDSFQTAAAGATAFLHAFAAGDAGGAVKGFFSTLAGGAKALDLIIPGLGQVASALVAVSGAVAGAVVGTLQSMAEKALEVGARVKLLASQLDALSGGRSGGGAALDLVNDIAKSTGQARTQVAELARSFEGMGIRDLDKLQQALLASRSAVANVGPAAEQAFNSLTQKLQAASEAGNGQIKVNARIVKALEGVGLFKGDFAELDKALRTGTADAAAFGDAIQQALIAKGAKNVAVMANSLEGIKNRFSNAFDRLFEGVKTEPFLEQLGKLVDLFDENTASGQAMHETIVATLDAIFDAATTALPYIRKGFILAGIAVIELLEVLDVLYEQFKATLDLGETAAAAASSFIEGLVNGITDGAAKVIEAAKGVANSIVDGVKDVLEIRSPSAVMVGVGGNVAEGMAQGIAANDNVQDAAENMGRSTAVAAGQAAAEGSGGGAVAGGGGGMVVNVGGIHISGAGKDAQELAEETWVLMLERVAAAQGLGTQAA